MWRQQTHTHTHRLTRVWKCRAKYASSLWNLIYLWRLCLANTPNCPSKPCRVAVMCRMFVCHSNVLNKVPEKYGWTHDCTRGNEQVDMCFQISEILTKLEKTSKLAWSPTIPKYKRVAEMSWTLWLKRQQLIEFIYCMKMSLGHELTKIILQYVDVVASIKMT